MSLIGITFASIVVNLIRPLDNLTSKHTRGIKLVPTANHENSIQCYYFTLMTWLVAQISVIYFVWWMYWGREKGIYFAKYTVRNYKTLKKLSELKWCGITVNFASSLYFTYHRAKKFYIDFKGTIWFIERKIITLIRIFSWFFNWSTSYRRNIGPRKR